MNRLLAFASLVLITACPSGSGTQGPQGDQGPAGATGPAGPAGMKGDKGDPGQNGAPGVEGAAGMNGTPGAQGPQGLQGPAGMVLVLDGGIVTGPAGSSVVVTVISSGGTLCPTGGVRVTQLSDGGISNVCNGDVGPQGPRGVSLTATTLPALSPQCPTGGVLVGLTDGGTLPVCNGAQGAIGATGPAGSPGTVGAQGVPGPAGSPGPTGAPGATGAQGVPGPTGPPGATGGPGSIGATGPAGAAGPAGIAGPMGSSGPPGQVLFLDGGVLVISGGTPEFAGFTTATYTGALGGYPGANAKCSAEFPGSYLCTTAEFEDANGAVSPGAAGAWSDGNRFTSGQREASSCSNNGAWNWGLTGSSGRSMNAIGAPTSSVCNEVKPLACCRRAGRFVFRGFTTATFTGALGGYLGANAKCSAEFAGSYLCTTAEFEDANGAVSPGAAGAWSDGNRFTSGQREASSCSA